MIGYLTVGIIAGFAAFVLALVLGASIWLAFLSYELAGVFTVIVMAGLVLVVRKVQPLPRPASSPSPAPEPTGLRILAVDDDPFILELLPKIASRVGCTDITLASSGQEALDRIAAAAVPFDCLLLDINMPDLSGIELCAQVRQMVAYHDTPIIMLTAMTDMNHLDRAFLAGASDYASKPFDIIAFGSRLQTARAQVEARRAAARSEPGPVTPPDALRTGVNRHLARAGVASLIGYDALQNYLKRLSGKGLTEACVVAVVVDWTAGTNIDKPRIAPMRLLATVARAIDGVPGAAGALITCAGPSLFVIVSSAARLPDVRALEQTIQSRVDRAMSADPGWLGQSATIFVGPAVRPGETREDRARTAFDRAIQLATYRAAQKRRYGTAANLRTQKG